MDDERKSRERLLQELQFLRQERSRSEAFLGEHKRIEGELLERVKELNCLYGVTQLAQSDIPLPELATGIAELICASWQFPESACARLTIDGQGFATQNFRRVAACQEAQVYVQEERTGSIEVCYLDERPEADEGPFLKEERKLLNALADLVGRIVTQRRVESQMRALSRELIRIQETERQRIARELHDHLAQDLSLARMGLERIWAVQPAPLRCKAQADDVLGRISAAIGAIRNLAYGLLPPGLSELGLVETVLRHCEEFTQRHGIEVDVYADGMESVCLDFETQINLYRLIQESLTNTRKHGAASRVEIRMLAAFPDLLLRIADNGRGADLDRCLVKAGKERRMGLWSMRERVRLLGGKITFRSKPGAGMCIRVEAPLTRTRRERQKAHPDR
jgi:signal transduction histidine kinase